MKLTFSADQILSQADSMLYGHFLEHFHRQIYGGVYDPASPFADEDGFRADVIEALRAIKTPIIRWPGGCYVSAYHWHDGVGVNRQPTYDKAWMVEESHAFGTDEFIKLCRKIGCEPYICTNAGTGGAEEMSDWVEYCNLKDMGKFAKERAANGYPQPHNVKYWSIGNENWGAHEIGAKNAAEWGELVREAAKMMLKVDPTIQLSAATIPELDWNVQLLRSAGRFLDWISIHSYYDWGGRDYTGIMMRTGDSLSACVDQVRAYLVALGLEKQVKIAYDEWNLRGWYHPNVMAVWDHEQRDIAGRENYYMDNIINPRNMNDDNTLYTMADAVFSGAFLNMCLRNCDLVKMACFSPCVNTRGAIFTHRDGMVLRPQYFVFQLYANYMKETVLNSWQADVPVLAGVDQGRECQVSGVDAVVTMDAQGYAIAAINKCPGEAHTLNLRLLDGGVSEMRVHTVNGPSENAYNDIGHTQVGITHSPWQPFTGSVTLESHSVNVIELRP